jgi:hypothetical protein
MNNLIFDIEFGKACSLPQADIEFAEKIFLRYVTFPKEVSTILMESLIEGL